jgi:hypothetical protein
VVKDVCRVRYDNERGKRPYAFRGLEQLLSDFWRDVNERR